ncbi:serine hydrolase domain-containing protein [Nocardia sp. NPDC051570]|uniref:serine hydrolase domain-containing protein n=1 Tax=Nocardia sp. NPDC051570 TaxID=3364324 RepID=UPI0037B2957A
MTATIPLHGTCDPRFDTVRDAFAENFAEHGEIGAALSVFHRGDCVVDLWAGTADLRTGHAWQEDTLCGVLSATKGVTATCVNILIDRGVLDPAAPVATYWPEFARAGKAEITVAWLLSHQAGLPRLDAPLPLEQALRWNPMIDALAVQKPSWTPGTAHGYHPQTFGWLAGELIRRIDGRSVSAFLAEEIAEPLQLDLHIGLPTAEHHRLARLVFNESPDRATPRRPPIALTTPPIDFTDAGTFLAEMPAVNGVATARALAHLYAALIDPAAPLLSPATIAAATTEQVSGHDVTLQAPTRFGLGYSLHSQTFPLLSESSFGHSGKGGSLAFADTADQLAVAYIPNHLLSGYGHDPRRTALFEALRRALGQQCR